MTPIFDTLLREFAGRAARQAVRDALGFKPTCCTERDNGRRLEILHDSALVFAMAANA